MDQFFKILHYLCPLINLLACIALYKKAKLMALRKEVNLTNMAGSLLRIYSRHELYINIGSRWNKYMRTNNFINYYFYFALYINILLFIVFKRF